MLCMQELFFGGWVVYLKHVSDVYMLIEGKKSINAEKNENIELTHCRLQSGFKIVTENLKSFFVQYVITCHLPTHRASRNRFSTISFHDYLHYFGIFLAHFLMKIDCNIISSLHIVFSLCARVVWCDVCTDFTNVNHICQQNKHIPLKKMIIRTTFKAVNCVSNVVRVKYSIVTSRLNLHLLLLRR